MEMENLVLHIRSRIPNLCRSASILHVACCDTAVCVQAEVLEQVEILDDFYREAFHLPFGS